MAARAGGHGADAGRHQQPWPRGHARTSPAFRADGPAPSPAPGRAAAWRPMRQTISRPPIARLEEYARGSALVSGPLSSRRGSGRWRRMGRLAEPQPRARAVDAQHPRLGLRARGVCGCRRPARGAPSVGSSAPRDLFRNGWRFRIRRPLRAIPPSTCNRHGRSGRRLAGAGGRSAGFTQRSRTTRVRRPGGRDGTAFGRAGSGSRRRGRRADRRGGWRLECGSRPSAVAASRHQLEFGADLDSASTSTRDQFGGTVYELIDSVRARIWNYTAPQTESRRRAVTATGFVSDTIALSPALRLDASLRAEVVHGSADGAATSVNWFSLLPAARIRWLFADRGRFALVGGYARSANALNLNWLAYGDPAAHVARVAADARPAVIVARVGPGTGGNPLVQPDRRRPSAPLHRRVRRRSGRRPDASRCGSR